MNRLAHAVLRLSCSGLRGRNGLCRHLCRHDCFDCLMALVRNNLRRLLLTFEALADLGPTLTGESDFRANAAAMLRGTLEAAGAREGVLFVLSEKPLLLRSAAVHGLAALPDPAIIPLLPKHVHA